MASTPLHHWLTYTSTSPYLPKVMKKVESLISQRHISLHLALRDWINGTLIPDHLHQSILTADPSEYHRQYCPTVEDVRNMSR